MEENTEKTSMEMEQSELNLLIGQGIKFSIAIKAVKRKKSFRIFGRSKPEIEEKTLTFEIHEPTLDTLDRISEISLKMAVSEEELKGNDFLGRAKRLAKENARNLARIIAVAVLGEDYYETEITHISATSVKIKRHKQDERLNSLSDLFFHTVTPSKLAELATVITSVSNLADFLASMRLLSDARTAIPRKESIE
jgi:hypothetical protein